MVGLGVTRHLAACIGSLGIGAAFFSMRPRLLSHLAGELLDVEQDAGALAKGSHGRKQDNNVQHRQGENHKTEHVIDARA
jgi:hypothetical protein